MLFSEKKEVLGKTYGVIDLLGAYSAEFWTKVANTNHKYLWNSLNEDLVIDDYDTSAGKKLYWDPPQASFSYWWSNAASNFFAAIGEAGSRGIEGLTQGLREATERIIMTGLAALLDQLRGYLPNFQPDDFLNLFNKFQRVGDLAVAVFNDPAKVAKTLGTGVENGFKQFFGNIGENLQTAFFEWLFSELPKKGINNVQIPAAPYNDIPKLIGFALELMGLTVDNILGLVREKAPNAYGVGLGVYELLSVVYEQGMEGVADLLGGKAANLLGGDAELKMALTDGLSGNAVDLNKIFNLTLNAGTKVIEDQVVKALVTQLFEVMLALADATGISAVVKVGKSIYLGIDFVLGKAAAFGELVQSLIQGVDDLINNNPTALTKRVIAALGKVATLLLSFLLKYLGLGQVPGDIAEAIAGLQKKVRELLSKALDGLLNVGKSLLGLSPTGAISDDDNDRLTKKVWSNDKKVQVWLQKKGKSTVVMVQASPQNELTVVLTALEKTAPATVVDKIKKDISIVTTTQTTGKPLALASVSTKVPTGQKAGEKLGETRKTIETQLKSEANMLSDLGLSCLANSVTKSGTAGPKQGTCIDSGTKVCFKDEPATLEHSPVGRVLTGKSIAAKSKHDWAFLRLLRLEMEYGDGNGVEAHLLRGLDWLAEHLVMEGGVLWLDLPEVGLSGWATVRAVEPCPVLEEGDGPLVTGWFKHRSGKVYDLVVAGEAKNIGITATHPVWSVDQEDWIPAADLGEGERLLADDGSTPRVVSLSLRAGREPVYNIEVDADHCYRVGEQGILVHNASVVPDSIAKAVDAVLPNKGDCPDATIQFKQTPANEKDKWRSQVGDFAAKSIFYVIYDDVNKTIMRVGEAGNGIERLAYAKTCVNKTGRSLTAYIWAADGATTRADREAKYEKPIIARLRSQGNTLAWNEGGWVFKKDESFDPEKPTGTILFDETWGQQVRDKQLAGKPIVYLMKSGDRILKVGEAGDAADRWRKYVKQAKDEGLYGKIEIWYWVLPADADESTRTSYWEAPLAFYYIQKGSTFDPKWDNDTQGRRKGAVEVARNDTAIYYCIGTKGG